MTSLTKNPHPPTKKIFLFASYKTCHVFWTFDRVSSAYWTGEIPAQSHVGFGVFFSKIPDFGQTPSVEYIHSMTLQLKVFCRRLNVLFLPCLYKADAVPQPVMACRKSNMLLENALECSWWKMLCQDIFQLLVVQIESAVLFQQL